MDVFIHYSPSDSSSNSPPSLEDLPPVSGSKQRDNRTPVAYKPVDSRTEALRVVPKLHVGARKGHRKSRNGCFTCKRVKLKCKENRPICDYCAHRGLNCEWPKGLTKREGGGLGLSSGTISRKPPADTAATASLPYMLQSDAPIYTMHDFKLFNHFVQKAYPRHPKNNDAVWKHEIPCLATDYDYLLHSMLALAASELAQTEKHSHQLQNLALAHRVKSITALNAAIQRGVNSSEEGNAMLATCFSLLFQSTLITEGLIEYMTFMRGTIVVSTQMYGSKLRFFFDRTEEDDRPTEPPDGTRDVPIIQRDLVLGACRSLESLKSLCHAGAEIQIRNKLLDIARSLLASTAHAYFKLRSVYRHFACTMSHEDFRYYCDPNNQVCRILQAHFVALQLIMEPINKHEEQLALQYSGSPHPQLSATQQRAKCPVKENSRAATRGWLAALHRDIPVEFEGYYEWTRWIEREVCRGTVLGGCPVSGKGMGGVEEDRGRSECLSSNRVTVGGSDGG